MLDSLFNDIDASFRSGVLIYRYCHRISEGFGFIFPSDFRSGEDNLEELW
jgi:hypothetical protein